MDKRQELDTIAQEISNCKSCKKDTSGIAVPGEGNPDAKIVFIGEAPGKQEAISGRPFIGRSGKLLRKTIEDIGLSPEEVYITSPVKYLPNKGTPSPSQIQHGKGHLEKQLAVIKPTLVVLMGATACNAILGQALSIQKMHGELIIENNTRYFITFHPAAALRFPRTRELFIRDFSSIKGLY